MRLPWLPAVLLVVVLPAAATPASDRSDHQGASGRLRPLIPDELPERPPPAPPPAPGPKRAARWADADAVAYSAGAGTVSLCETATIPLNLLPVVGPGAALVTQWFCIIPAAVTVDYIAIHHGGRDAAFWQAGLALAASKAFSDLTELPWVVSFTTTTISAGLVAAATYVTGGLDFLPADVPEAYRPLAITGYITGTTALTAFLNVVRDFIAWRIYTLSYDLLTDKLPPKDNSHLEDAYLDKSLNPFERAFLLAALTEGVQPDFSLWHIVPVVGRFVLAYDRADLLRHRLRRVSKDTFRDDREVFLPMDAAIFAVFGLDCGFGVLTDVALIASAGIFLLGTSLVLTYGPAALGTGGVGRLVAALGTAGLFASSAAVSLTLVREARRVVGPALVSLAYGPVPDAWIDAVRDELTTE